MTHIPQKDLVYNYFSSQSDFHSVPKIDVFLLNCDLFCPSWSHQGQDYQTLP